jgi:hypothetical protein
MCFRVGRLLPCAQRLDLAENALSEKGTNALAYSTGRQFTNKKVLMNRHQDRFYSRPFCYSDVCQNGKLSKTFLHRNVLFGAIS